MVPSAQAAVMFRRHARSFGWMLRTGFWGLISVVPVGWVLTLDEYRLGLGAIGVVFAGLKYGQNRSSQIQPSPLSQSSQSQTSVRLSPAQQTTLATWQIEVGVATLSGAVLLTSGLAAISHFSFWPLLPLLVMVMVALLSTRPGYLVFGLALLSQLTPLWLVPTAFHLDQLCWVAAFGIVGIVLPKAEVARIRSAEVKRSEVLQKQRKDEARIYRLTGSANRLTDKSDEAEFPKGLDSSIDEVHQALYYTLTVLKRSLELHTVAVYVFDGQQNLRLVEAASDSDYLVTDGVSAKEGLLGAVVQRREIVQIDPRSKNRTLGYCSPAPDLAAVIGLPILEGARLVGVLVADRIRPSGAASLQPISPASQTPAAKASANGAGEVRTGFSSQEEVTFQRARDFVLRTLQNERVFLQLERTKREQEILFAVSQKMSSARTEEDVMRAVVASVRAIAAFDFLAITDFNASGGTHRVRWAEGQVADKIQNLTFKDNTSLVAMVIKNRHYLPYRGEFDASQQTVFNSKVKVTGLRSMLVLPLVVAEDAIGTLCVGSAAANAFSASTRSTLGLLTSILAVAWSNAKATKKLEELATTDGLTGCLNKRAFLDELEQMFRSASRFNKRFSLLVTDIDHFKSVNDTHGHATGDVVIKALGEILQRVKRETDKVARFGGEEFCILCEETDTEGAVQLAERIRDELKKRVFSAEKGNVQVTCSLGVATYPVDATTPAMLFEVTDKALYVAKRSGRDRVCTVRDL